MWVTLYVNPTGYKQIIKTENAQKLTLDEQTCLSEDQKHTSNVTKIHYQKHRSENVTVKARSCLEKLQDSSKSSEQLSVVTKPLTLVIKQILKEKNQASKGYDRKKQLFQIARTISYAKGFLSMAMVDEFYIK